MFFVLARPRPTPLSRAADQRGFPVAVGPRELLAQAVMADGFVVHG